MLKRTALCLLFILSIALPAAAAPLPVLPSNTSDWLFVLNPDGTFFKGAWCTEAQELANGALFVYMIPDSSLVDQNPTPFPPLTILVDTDSGGNPIIDPLTGQWVISDFVEVERDQTTGLLYLGFQSGPPLTLGDIPIGFPFTVLEFKTPFNVTSYLTADLQRQGYTAWFGSDIAPSTVPEPGTLILVSFGIAVLLGSALKRI